MDLRKLIAVVPQSSHLFAGTVAENMRWGNPNATEDDISAALEAAGALDFVLNSKGTNLSGGQKQRILVSRALSGNPDILILDDSSSALDYKTDAALRNAVFTEMTNSTVIMLPAESSGYRSK